MSDILPNAARKTTHILQETDLAVTLLSADYSSGRRINALGILSDPHTYLVALQSARSAIDRAIADHQTTTWPTDRDYNAV